MSIIGESIDTSVSDQISTRQLLHGKQTRTNTDLSILNNTNAWLKLASSVRVVSQTDEEKKANTNSIATYNTGSKEFEDSTISSGEQRLRNIGLNNTGEFTGNQLAKKSVLFNTLSELNSSGTYNSRSGIASTNSLWNNSSYGLGGTDFGLVPAPGLLSAKIDCKNRGSIREATVELKAYNKFQFELIELLYLRLGYTMLLEWGWSQYMDKSLTQKQVGNTLTEDIWFSDDNHYNVILKKIKEYRKIYSCNYDGFLGKVVNFDWSFQPDGTYNITLKLITVGDVIESLKVKLPSDIITQAALKETVQKGNAQTAQLNKLSSPVVTNAGSSTLSLNLFNDIASSNIEFWKVPKTNYFSLFANLVGGDGFKIPTSSPSNDKDLYPPTGVDSNKYTYYLTFGELLDKLQKYCIPSINTDKVITFDTTTENICSTFINQVSFNPKICLIKPRFTTEIEMQSAEEFKTKNTGIKNFYGAFAKLKDFIISEEDTKVMYGDIMNIYLNYDFISTILEENTKDGNITLFKFLTSICDGINNSLGNLNKLEPIIQDDNVIKIIDQNPIPGIQLSRDFGCRFIDNPTPFEIYGYNYGDYTKIQSNFVRDFGFKTKIGPELASMITIGCTAQNKSTKNYDGTAFSKWNEGLEDAYAIEYDDPDDADLTKPTIQPEFYPFSSEQIQEMYDHFNLSEIDVYHGYDFIAEGLIWTGNRAQAELLRRKWIISSVGTYKAGGTRDIVDCPITHRDYDDYTWAEYFAKAKQVYLKQITKKEKEDSTKTQTIESYIQWLVNAFGGKLNGSSIIEPLYFYFNSDFYKIGSSLFNGFINEINTQVYENGKKLIPSNTIGFIPMDLNLTIDGLSGIKIYNALDVNQRFLPENYGTSLKFIITKVNHEISSNNWSTSLSTITVPKIEEVIDFVLNEAISTVVANQILIISQPEMAPSPENKCDENEIPTILNFIKDKEGFLSKSEWDRTAYRVGHGSDTITRANGQQEKVTQFGPSSTIDRAGALLDLERRVNEFRTGVISVTKNNGMDYCELPLKIKVVFVDLAYNYGYLFNSIILSYKNNGVNGLIKELQRRADMGEAQTPTRRKAEIKYLQS
jgi:hypothetical protein